MQFQVTSRKVFHYHCAIIAMLALLNCIALCARFFIPEPEYMWSINYFHFDKERNLPTYFSALALLTCSFVLGLIVRLNPPSRASLRNYWLLLSLIFLFLSVDEMTSVHERLMETLRNRFNFSGILYFAWVIPYGAAVAILGVCYLRFLFQLPELIRKKIVISAVVFLSGALGVEVFGSYVYTTHGKMTAVYMATITVEESLEFIGIALFLEALLSYLAVIKQPLTVNFNSQ